MDPSATLRELIGAVEAREWERVDELADALLTWLDKRGAPPRIIGPESLGKEWHRAMATFTCRLAQSLVRDARKRKRG